MLTVGVIDVNEAPKTDERFIHAVNSVVATWIEWEIKQAGLELTQPEEADVIFIVYAGQVDWRSKCGAALKRHKIQPDANKRNRTKYIIGGGAVDTAPFTALSVADLLPIGEAYIFIRQVLDIIKAGGGFGDIDEWAVDYPHALTRAEVYGYKRDETAPWLLENPAEKIAAPDEWVDWEGTPSVRSVGNFVRVLASKGCHLKCKFCATTYRQTYRIAPDEQKLLAKHDSISATGAAVGFITNDAAALPYFGEIAKRKKLDNQSLTLKAVRDPSVLASIVSGGTKSVRIGLEGISPRVRQAFGKPITNEELLDVVDKMTRAKVFVTLFTIIASPYETEEDWKDFSSLWVAMTKKISSGLVQFKYNSFSPNAPTPLAYFIPDDYGFNRLVDFRTWTRKNYKSRHVTDTPPRQPKRRILDLTETYDIDKKTAEELFYRPGTTDIAPDVETAMRFTWELIDWPLHPIKRWKLSRNYMKWMEAM